MLLKVELGKEEVGKGKEREEPELRNFQMPVRKSLFYSYWCW
jgi:hypothetical protein